MATGLHSDLRLAPAQAEMGQRGDGTLLLRSPQTLGHYPRAVGEWLGHWAAQVPSRVFLAERAADGWRELTYREALDAARRIGQALLERGLDASRPVAILSDISIDHALVTLGAMHAGIPAAPVSPAYSLMSRDFAKLKAIFALAQPGLVFATEPEKFAPALAALGATATPIDALLAATPDDRIESAYNAIRPDTVAKILFTSGSTGNPKGVINTQRMLCANQQQLAQGWPFVAARPPVVVDWLPWSHTFGGNHNFNLVLRNGGSLYIDAGKPAPGLVETTVRNLKDVSPTMYFNVPRGYDLLLPYLEADAALRANFFRELDVLFYAAAALPQNLWQRIEDMAVAEKGGRLAMLSAWGATETAPLATQVHFPMQRAGVIGLPVAGCALKLVPAGDKLEARVRGANITPGYYQRDDLTRAAFDDEGFWRTGDAMRLADPANPAAGVVFDGRVAENFKLSSGTWVHVDEVRVKLIAAGNPLIQDAVITGHDRDEVGALAFLNPGVAADLSEAQIRERLAAALAALAADSGAGSSMRPTRLLILIEPPSIDANEITDKGYVNQRAVLENRAQLVEQLYADGPAVITI